MIRRNMIGFVYPAYFSLVALNSKDREDDTKWSVLWIWCNFRLTYWVVFGFFSIIESIVSIFAKLYNICGEVNYRNVMYYIVKIVMLVCCFIPDIDVCIGQCSHM